MAVWVIRFGRDDIDPERAAALTGPRQRRDRRRFANESSLVSNVTVGVDAIAKILHGSIMDHEPIPLVRLCTRTSAVTVFGLSIMVRIWVDEVGRLWNGPMAV